MDLRRYTGFLIKRGWLILLGTALVTGMTYFLARTMEPVYAASITLLVEQGVDPRTDPYGSILTSQRAAVTYVQIIEALPTLERAVSESGISLSPATLAAKISVQQIRDTELIRLSVEDPSPESARTLAEAVATAFIGLNQERAAERFDVAKTDLERTVASLEREIDRKQSELAGLQGARGLGEGSVPLFARQQEIILGAELVRLQTKYSISLGSLEDFRLASTRYATSITVASPAQTPTLPVRPNIPLYLLIAALLGLASALAVAALLEYLDDTVKTSDDVEATLHLPTVGNILRIDNLSNRIPVIPTFMATSRSSAVEAFRVLRTNIELARPDHPVHSLLVTSAVPGEGKTLTASGLAIVQAQAGKRVILVDSDLRRASLHHSFGLSNDRGLTNMITADDPETDAFFQESGIPGLRILTSGPMPPNPAELLGSDKMRRVARYLKSRADLVIFDSPPVLPVTDAALLSTNVDGVLLVVDAGHTRRDIAQRAKGALEQVGATLLGVTINKLRPMAGYGYYYYYYYRYYYSEDGASGRTRQRRRSERSLGRRMGRFLQGLLIPRGKTSSRARPTSPVGGASDETP